MLYFLCSAVCFSYFSKLIHLLQAFHANSVAAVIRINASYNTLESMFTALHIQIDARMHVHGLN